MFSQLSFGHGIYGTQLNESLLDLKTKIIDNKLEDKYFFEELKTDIDIKNSRNVKSFIMY